MLVGARFGTWVWSTIVTPRRPSVLALAALALGTPLVTGMIDLYLRTHTP